MTRLANKTAIITGGASGIGLATGKLFVQKDAQVLLVDSNEDALQDAMASIDNNKASYVVADVTQPEQVQNYTRTAVERYGGIDVFINNASVLGERLSVEQANLDVWKKVIEINLTGAFVCARAIIPYLRETQGSLINVSSGVGDHGRSLWGAYCVSKNGLEAMSEIMASELSTDRIRVNTVDPGSMRTSMRAAAYPDEDPETLPEPDEVVGVFEYLASDRSQEVSGQRFRAKDFKASVL